MKIRSLLTIATLCLASLINELHAKVTSQETIQLRQSYPSLLEDIQKKRLALHQRLQSRQHTRKAIITESREYLIDTLRQKIFPAWYGTPWDFNGTSQVPGEGKIACGYFVSTSLTHLGYKVNRFRLAQQPSQRIIETFMPKSQRTILKSQAPIANVATFLKSKGNGIYIVGLDRHVGFISVDGDHLDFIHSSCYSPSLVVSEPINSKNPLRDSKYRVIGKLFSDEMVLSWLAQKSYSVKTR